MNLFLYIGLYVLSVILSLVINFFISFLVFDKIVTKEINLSEYLFNKNNYSAWIMFMLVSVLPNIFTYSITPRTLGQLAYVITNAFIILLITPVYLNLLKNLKKYLQVSSYSEIIINNDMNKIYALSKYIGLFYLLLFTRNLALIILIPIIFILSSKLKEMSSIINLFLLYFLIIYNVAIIAGLTGIFAILFTLIVEIIYGVTYILICLALNVEISTEFKQRNLGFIYFTFIWAFCILFAVLISVKW